MRKTRRKIERKKRVKTKSKKRNRLSIWVNKPISNRFTRLSTILMLIVEVAFLGVCTAWALVDIFK